MKGEAKRHVCGELVFRDPNGQFHHRHDRECQLPPMSKCPFCGHQISEDWFRELYRVEPMPYRMMLYTIKKRACSNCWEYGFQVYPVDVELLDPETQEPTGEIETMYRVLCSSCLEETQGYVTSMYVGSARGQDYEDALRSMIGLAPALGMEINDERRTQAQNIEELGF